MPYTAAYSLGERGVGHSLGAGRPTSCALAEPDVISLPWPVVPGVDAVAEADGVGGHAGRRAARGGPRRAARRARASRSSSSMLSSRRTRLRARSMRTGVTSVPKAESTLALAGNTTLRRLEQLGHAAGVHRPGAAERDAAATPRRSTPRSTACMRAAAAMFWLTSSCTPPAVSTTSSAERARPRSATAVRGGVGVERHVAAEEEAGVEEAEQHVGVGDRRLGAAAAVARRPGLGAGRLGARP